MPRDDLGSLFIAGSLYRWTDGTPFELQVVDVGELKLTTGNVVACDPAWPLESVPMDEATAVTVAPGSYPVSLSVANRQSGSALGLVSAARISVSEDPVEQWVPAMEGVASDGATKPLGIAVDSGQACLTDEATIPFLTALSEDDDAYDALSERVVREMFAPVEDQTTDTNAIIINCGMGDGVYPVWLGLTASSDVAQIILDLQFLSHCQGPELPASPSRPD